MIRDIFKGVKGFRQVDETQIEMTREDGSTIVLPLDPTDKESIKAFLDAAQEFLGISDEDLSS